MELREILARNLRVARAARRLSQERLGELTGVARNYIGEIERCEKAASVDTIEALAKGLELPVDALLHDEPMA